MKCCDKMNFKKQLKEIKKLFMEKPASYSTQESPVLISERGFVLFSQEEMPVKLSDEMHYQSLQKIIKNYYPEQSDSLIKKYHQDHVGYIHFLTENGNTVFLNHSLVNLNDYQKNPNLIYRSMGILYLPSKLEDLTFLQANTLLKYKDDFRRMQWINIVEVHFKDDTNEVTYQSIPLPEFETRLQNHLTQIYLKKIKKTR